MVINIIMILNFTYCWGSGSPFYFSTPHERVRYFTHLDNLNAENLKIKGTVNKIDKKPC